ncbi:MAG: excinuclease ABC subunit UvrA [Verrucomicrobiota bacterium]
MSEREKEEKLEKDARDKAFIRITGARQHNLKNLTVEIPRNQLTVITGPSGSGKSSLAFDTLFAEGQRRYVNSLSAYARQFLDQMGKPDIDSIEGLSPTVAIEQKSGASSPRSTIATVTEILDYLRILYSSCGQPHHPETGKPLYRYTSQEIVDKICAEPTGSRFILLAPVVSNEKGNHKTTLQHLRRSGFLRVRIDGEINLLEEVSPLREEKPHTIEVIVDRLKVAEDTRSRVTDSVELGLKTGQGLIYVLWIAQEEGEPVLWALSNDNFDAETGFRIPQLTPRHFSFNSPLGACPACEGIGTEAILDDDLIIPDPELTLEEGAIAPWSKAPTKLRSVYVKSLQHLAARLKINLSTRWCDLAEEVRHSIIYGIEERDAGGQAFPGIRQQLEELYAESTASSTRQRVAAYMTRQTCRSCHGSRLRPEMNAVTLKADLSDKENKGGCRSLSLHALCELSIDAALCFLKQLALTAQQKHFAPDLIDEIVKRLNFLKNVGLGYLALSRESATLSGGELQRIRLATQLGSSLTGVVYVLDEPSIGLHQRDNDSLLQTLEALRDKGNTVVLVEHDEETIRCADYIIELGPTAGDRGGFIVSQGTPHEIMQDPSSITGRYLSGQESISVPGKRVQPHKGYLRVKGARAHNLQNIDAAFPLSCFTCVTGVSGSGKSTLVNHILARALMKKFCQKKDKVGAHEKITGAEEIDKVIVIDASPIGRTPRSNPLTYIGAFNEVRDLFAQLPLSRIRGYKKDRFSFNTKGGRCEHCKGDGAVKVEMHFLPDVFVTCEHCQGQRFNRETLEVTYKGFTIADILNLSVDKGLDVFAHVARIRDKLESLSRLGLGYLKLGQPANTLSGGEAQRIKLAAELARQATGRTCYILDEPTTGLHFADIEYLLKIIYALRDAGNTMIVIEHHLDIIKCADYIMELGPEGGSAGGKLICCGSPEEIAKQKQSPTSKYLHHKMNVKN